jgi:hypothetical protein
MTRTIARLILAMLLLPATGAVFLLTVFVAVPGGRPPTAGGLLALWGVVYLFIAVYWLVLWRGVVRWTRRRVLMTAGATGLALVGGAAFGAVSLAINPRMPPPIAILLGGGFVPIVWVLATVLVWTETRAERADRLRALGGPRAVTCPVCGYSLTGLMEARCPECGGRFTLDQLLAAQADADAGAVVEG